MHRFLLRQNGTLSGISGRGKLGHACAGRNCIMVQRAALLAPHLVGDLAGDLSVAQFEAMNQANVRRGFVIFRKTSVRKIPR